MLSRVEDGLEVVQMVKRFFRRFRTDVNVDSDEIFDHIYISRRNHQNDRFRVYHFIRGSFFANTIIYVYQF